MHDDDVAVGLRCRIIRERSKREPIPATVTRVTRDGDIPSIENPQGIVRSLRVREERNGAESIWFRQALISLPEGVEWRNPRPEDFGPWRSPQWPQHVLELGGAE